MKLKIVFAALLITGSQLFAQQYLEKEFKGYTNPEEIVTLSANISFDQAVALLNKVSERTTGKKIVSTVSLQEPVGVPIENMAYDKALVVLVQYKGLTYEEKEDVIIIKRRNEPESIARTADTYAPVEEREVKISAVFFEMDVNESKEKGIDWKVILSGSKGDIGGMLGLDPTVEKESSGEEETLPTFNLGGNYNFDIGNFFGEATAVFKFFESENVGEIIASPNLAVRDRKTARLQAGADISIKQRDFAGNVIEEFYSTGTIMSVTPYVHREDGLDYILLNIEVERSSFVPDQTTTIINKTKANTQALMLNGEETVIGGLFINDETTVRNGIPVLKDLPWWFFGLRYLFGSDKKVIQKKELVILIKSELIPTLKERLAWPQSPNLLQDELKKQRQKMQIHQFNQLPTNEN